MGDNVGDSRGGQCHASSVLSPAASVRSVTARVLKIISPDFMQISVVLAVCAQKVMVAPPRILHLVQ